MCFSSAKLSAFLSAVRIFPCSACPRDRLCILSVHLASPISSRIIAATIGEPFQCRAVFIVFLLCCGFVPFSPRNIFPGGAWGHLPTAVAPTPAGENTFSVGQHALPTGFSSVRRMSFTRQHWNGEVCIHDKTSAAKALARMMRAAHPVMKKLAWYGRGRGGLCPPAFWERTPRRSVGQSSVQD